MSLPATVPAPPLDPLGSSPGLALALGLLLALTVPALPRNAEAARPVAGQARPAPASDPGTLALLESQLARLLLQHFAGSPGPPLQRDAALDAVARENNDDLAVRGPAPVSSPGVGAAPTFDPARLGQLLAQHDVAEVGVMPLACATALDRAQPDLLRLLALPQPAGTPRPDRFGLALRPATGPDRPAWLTVLLLRRRATFDLLPVRVEASAPLPVRGELAPDVRDPRLLYIGPSGQVHELPLRSGLGRFAAELEFSEGIGVYQLQLLVDGELGPQVAAARTVYVGVPVPPLPVVRLLPGPAGSAAGDVAATEQQARALLAAERQRLGLPALQPQAQLTLAAREHSQEMRDQRYFGHVSPAHRTPEDRLRRFGLTPRQSAENIALAPDVVRAHADLLASPAHRRNALDPQLTHLGVGVAWGGDPPDTLFLTELFARLEPDDPGAQPAAGSGAPGTSPAALLARANALRQAAGLPQLVNDPGLQDWATQLARQLVGPGSSAAPELADLRRLLAADPRAAAIPGLSASLLFAADPLALHERALADGQLLGSRHGRVGLVQQRLADRRALLLLIVAR